MLCMAATATRHMLRAVLKQSVWQGCKGADNGAQALKFNVHAQAMNTLFFSNNYDWRPFVIAMVASVMGMLFMGALEILILQPLLGGLCPGYFNRRRPGSAATVPPQKHANGAQRTQAPPLTAKKQMPQEESLMYAAYPKA